MWSGVKLSRVKVFMYPGMSVDPIRNRKRLRRAKHEWKKGPNTGSTVRPPLHVAQTLAQCKLGAVQVPQTKIARTGYAPPLEVAIRAVCPSHFARLSLSTNRGRPLTGGHRCLRNLSTHRTKRPAPPYPRAHSAAVLVALFVGRAGDLYVLLSQ